MSQTGENCNCVGFTHTSFQKLTVHSFSDIGTFATCTPLQCITTLGSLVLYLYVIVQIFCGAAVTVGGKLIQDLQYPSLYLIGVSKEISTPPANRSMFDRNCSSTVSLLPTALFVVTVIFCVSGFQGFFAYLSMSFNSQSVT